MIDDVLANLSPALRKQLMTGDTMRVADICPSPSLSLNMALNGGWRYGRQHLIYGNKSATKSSMLLQTIGQEQKRGKTAAWIDSETTYDPVWAARLGVDNSKLILSQVRTINDMTDVGQQLMRAGVDIIVVDSISTLLPAVYFEKDGVELKELADTRQMGSEAADLTKAVKILNYANNRDGETALFLISQVRNNLGAMFVNQVPTGGKAVQFYSSTIVRLTSSESEKNAIKAKVDVGNRTIEQNVGRKVSWDVTFSKTSAPFQSGSYDFYFSGKAGVDQVGELVDIAEANGHVTKSGAWYKYNDKSYQGRDGLVAAVRDDVDLQNDLMKAINGEV